MAKMDLTMEEMQEILAKCEHKTLRMKCELAIESLVLDEEARRSRGRDRALAFERAAQQKEEARKLRQAIAEDERQKAHVEAFKRRAAEATRRSLKLEMERLAKLGEAAVLERHEDLLPPNAQLEDNSRE